MKEKKEGRSFNEDTSSGDPGEFLSLPVLAIESEVESPQWDTDGIKENLTGVITLSYSIQNKNKKIFAFSSTL